MQQDVAAQDSQDSRGEQSAIVNNYNIVMQNTISLEYEEPGHAAGSCFLWLNECK